MIPTNQPTHPCTTPLHQDKDERARREAEAAAREAAALEAAAVGGGGGGGGDDGVITLKLQWVGADGKKMQVVKMRPTDTFEVRGWDRLVG